MCGKALPFRAFDPSACREASPRVIDRGEASEVLDIGGPEGQRPSAHRAAQPLKFSTWHFRRLQNVSDH